MGRPAVQQVAGEFGERGPEGPSRSGPIGHDPARAHACAPPIDLPPDTKWVKHIKIQSKLLTAWWGRPIYLGATVLLPRGYDADTARRYPTVYQQGHFTLNPPFGFSTDSTPETAAERAARLARSAREPGFEFYRAWSAPISRA